MANKRYVLAGTIGLGVAIGVGLVSMEPVAGPAKPEKRLVAPIFQVDPFWPKPLPDNWVTGEIGGTCIDSQDHLFIDRKSTRLNSSHPSISYAVFCLKKKKQNTI